MTELTNKDYTQILEYYNKNIPSSKRLLKMQAEKILATKLCRCIKNIDPVNESKSIGICTKTIINRKGYTRGKFSCKKKTKIQLTKFKNSTRKNRK
jgi:hypothetical protein